MKNSRKIYGLAIVAALIFAAHLLAGCALSTNGETLEGPPPTFTSIAELGQWLSSQPHNTPTTPYTVKLNVNDLGGNYNTNGSVGYALGNNSAKYVNLDLSGSTITTIPGRAFYFCSSLTSVTIGNGVTSIDSRAFAACRNLTSVTIGNSVISIGGGDGAYSGAFYGCNSLTSITIPDSVTTIGQYAFSQCASLTSVTIGNGVTSIGDSAFWGCASLTAINVDAGNTEYSSQDGVLYNKNKTTLIACPGGKTGAFTIPDSVTTIGGSAFSQCASLTSVTIGNGVTSIGDSAFSGCTSLTSVTIPNSVTIIGGYAFSGCTCLTSVTFQGTITEGNFNIDAFGWNFGNNDLYIGNVRDRYLSGGIGTYTRLIGEKAWTKM